MMESQNIQTALQGAKNKRKARMKTTFQDVCTLLGTFKKNNISDSVANKLLHLYYAAYDELMTEEYLYHESAWPKLAKRAGFRSVELMLQAVYDSRLFFFTTLSDDTRAFYNKNFKCYNDAADNAYVKKLEADLDCVVTEVVCEGADTPSDAELRSSNDAFCSAICSAICTNVQNDNALLGNDLSNTENGSSDTDTDTEESDSVGHKDPQSSDDSETDKPAAETPAEPATSTVMRMTVDSFEGKTWEERTARGLTALLKAESPNGGVLRLLIDDFVTTLAKELSCGPYEFKESGTDLRGLLNDVWTCFKDRHLAPYVVQRGMHKDGKQKLDAIEAWLLNSYKGGYLIRLCQTTMVEFTGRLQAIRRGLHTTHPFGCFEFYRPATQKRYYNDHDNGETEIPDDLPPRPSFGHVLSLDETRWVEIN